MLPLLAATCHFWARAAIKFILLSIASIVLLSDVEVDASRLTLAKRRAPIPSSTNSNDVVSLSDAVATVAGRMLRYGRYPSDGVLAAPPSSPPPPFATAAS